MVNLSILNSRVEIKMSKATQVFLDQLGRTEDIRFSSDNTKLAIAGFQKNCCLLLDISINPSGLEPTVNIVGSVKLTSNSLKEPHGVEFIGNDLLIVTNRGGSVVIFNLENLQFTDQVVYLNPIRIIKKAGIFKKLNSPGSICILNSSAEELDILVCNNYTHQISRHIIPLKSRLKFVKNSVFLKKGFNVPDGIAINKDKSWLAISNHFTSSVLMFDLHSNLTRYSEHSGELIKSGYPHGVRFSDDGKEIYVADAGSPFINLYQSQNGKWIGKYEPVKKLNVLTENAFIKGQTNPQEGGPKGLDISADGSLLAMTNHEAPLDIFYIKDLDHSNILQNHYQSQQIILDV